jgi:hypothetical protein
MRDWTLTSKDPLSLRIAADARQTTPNYVDDHIWDIELSGGEPQALAIETSYGLRAQRMRIFPGFSLVGGAAINPDQFIQAPIVRRIYPNYACIDCQPFEGLETQIELWARESNLLQGRIQLANQTSGPVSIGTRLYSQLRISEDGKPMGEWQFKGVTSLVGTVGDLAPLIFITGGARADHSIYPSLIVDCSLEEGETKSILWTHAGFGDHVASFEAARAAVAINWDAEIAKLELANRSMIDIETGEPDWDAAFLFSQKVAVGAYVGPTRHFQRPSFVLSRTSDRGYSASGDGSDYSPHWEGQSALQALAHIPQLIMMAPELAKGVIRNYLEVQDPYGFIDWKPGLGGQRNGCLSVPLLASLSWMIYEHTDDRAFLEGTIEGLISFINAWFDEKQDRDGDGFPEWDHTVQMGYDDCPTFTPWKLWGQGLDISTVESPDLASYLVKECSSLIKIAKALEMVDPIELLEEHVDRLSKAVEETWDNKASIYRYIDRDTHSSGKGEVLGSGEGEFVLQVDREFDQPARILIRSHGDEALSHAAQVFIHGRGKRGRHRVEKLRERHFHWFWGIGSATSEKTYAEIERIEVRGLSAGFGTQISIADHLREDAGLLLPLWAGIPDRKRAVRLIERTVLDEKRFFRANGIANCSALDPAYQAAREEGAAGIDMLRNTILGEALLEYGYLEEAVDLVQRLMGTVTTVLKSDGAFRESYDPDEFRSSGEKDHLSGLAPLGLFLKTLGVQLISQNKVVVRGTNPFPWPVKIRWRGLFIECMEAVTMIEFPDGSTIEITGEDSSLIERIEG